MSVLTDPISDFLTRFKNAGLAGREEFVAPYSKIKAEIARILMEEGYLWNYEVDTGGRYPVLRCKTKFVAGKPVLTNLQRVSRPGLRQYVSATEMPKVLGGMGISIISTSKGLMTGHKAKAEKVGGELLAKVW
jgi:small subunit ribosomal protein S8